MKPSLGPADVDLWVLDLDTIDPALLDGYRAMMSADERAQEERLRFPGGRERHCCTRALARTVLSHYTGVAPRDWVFRTGTYGKPDIAHPADVPLRFNLSHSGRLVVCAVTRGAEVGVDVERHRELPKAVELARRFFAPPEAAVVERTPADRRSRRFLRFWTFKESYVKARGVGLLVPLEGFYFKLEENAPPTIDFADPGSDRPAAWQFAEIRWADTYQLALALRRPHAGPMNLAIRRTVPLHSQPTLQRLPETPLRRWDVADRGNT